MKKHKILIWDIETTPILAEVWRTWKIDRVNRVVKDWEILSVSWQWLGSKKLHFMKRRNDSDANICRKLRMLWSKADMQVAQNGMKFDVPKTKARMIFHDRAVPKVPELFDTKKVASNEFGFTSNSLGDLCKYFGIPHKKDSGGYETWVGCMANKQEAWARMKYYNKGDVVSLRELYKILAPWAKNHPRLNTDPRVCSAANCGGHTGKRGFRLTKKTRIQRYQCEKCGSWS